MSPVDRLELKIPVFQAPMAGISTPELAAEVSNAGALGGIAVGASTPTQAHAMIEETKRRTGRPFNVNVFCHQPAMRDDALEQAWIARTRPLFKAFGAEPPLALREIYRSFAEDDEMLKVLVDAAPAVVSFHFGLPSVDRLAALRAVGAILIASATSLDEARKVEAAGIDVVVAQGWGAGGHRGIFDPDGPDDRLETEALTRQLAQALSIPVVAAGGIMTGHDVATALGWGAAAAQMGTAFVGCPQSAADGAYRDRLNKASAGGTEMTRVISGRPARCLDNRFVNWGMQVQDFEVAAYPCAYDLGKALNAAAKATGETGFGAQWAGSGAHRLREMPAAELVATLSREIAEAAAQTM